MERRSFLKNLAYATLSSGSLAIASPSSAKNRAELDASNPLAPVTHPISGRKLPAITAGIITPVYTPAKEGGRLDSRGLANYVDWLAKNPNVDGLFVRCGVGKMFTFTAAEIRQSIDVTVDTVAGRKFVQFSTFGVFDGNHYNRPKQEKYIAETIEFSRYAEERGASGIVLLMPWMLLPKKGESIEDMTCRYVGDVASAIEIPIVLYNPPTVPRDYSLGSSLLRRLTEIPNVVGAKISSTRMSWFSRLEEAAEGTNFSVISGTEWAYYQALMTGSLGVIGGGCNVYPCILKTLYEAFMNGEYNVARQTQWDVNNANAFFRGYSSSNGGLSYLRAKGLDIEPWDKTGKPLESKEKALQKYADLEPLLAKYNGRS